MNKYILSLLCFFVYITTVFSQTQVSVFNYPGLNGNPGECANENENLIGIISALPDYTVDASITSFANPTTLASQLDASTFFFMTDMENQNPLNETFFPSSSATVFKSWVNSGGVMVMTGTNGDNDTNFLNKIFSWNLSTASGSSWTKNTANTAGTPFEDVTASSLPALSATDAINRGSVPDFKAMWGTDANATVAVIKYGAGYVIFMGFDFYNTGPSCPQFSSDWVQQIIPAALLYATTLAKGAVSNITYTTADYTYTFSENGTAYYILVAGGALAPTAAQIYAGTSYSGVTIIRNGSASVTANIGRLFSLTGLNAGTNYDIYAVTRYYNGGYLYSSIEKANFSTLAYTLPELVTTSVSSITRSTASSGGNISKDGGRTINSKGICWNTTGNPTTTTNNKTENGSGTSAFVSSLTGLSSSTKYYVRAYATNSVGTGYGNEISFTTLPNNAPVANNDGPYNVNTGATVSGNILSNDSDADGDDIDVASVPSLSHGSFTSFDQETGAFTYQAPENWIGTFNTSYTATDNSATSNATIYFIVSDGAAPVVYTKDYTLYLNSSGTGTLTPSLVDDNSVDNIGITNLSLDKTLFDCSNIGANVVTLTAVDAAGNDASTTATVTVVDTVSPVAECKDITVYLDETGNISIAEDSINNGSLDACGGLTFDTDVTAFGCSDVGDNTVVLIVTDVNNNVSTCESTVTVIDTVRPVAECKDITVYLDETGNISIAEDSINNGSLDACGGLTFDTDVTAFGCAYVGDNTVVLTVTDVNNNVSTCESTVTVIDTVRPVAECIDIMVYLDETGNISIAEDSINNGSSDACGGLTFDTDVTAFGCAGVGGDNTVILTVTDVNGNVSTCESIVTVIDTVRPVAECKDITVYLDETGNISIAEDSINNGSSDTCGGLTFDTDVTAFGCSDVGDNTVVLTVADESGNISTCESTVTVIDTVRPVAECKDITVYLDETGNISIAEDSINNGSLDACGGLTFDTDVTAFSCADVGDNTVVLTVTDVNNNVSTCKSTVTVIDTVRPVAECRDITVYLDETGNISIAEDSINNGSSDACGNLTFDTDVTAFGCADVGDNTVVLTVTDVNNNVSTCESTVSVIDTVRPVAECKDITVYLDETGNISIAEDSINNGSLDACGGLTFDTDVTAFGCADVGGDNTVILTVTDVNGNVSTCESIVTVIDTVRPVAECKDISVYLDEIGNISIAEDSINNGSLDACGGLTFDTDVTAFGCSDVGDNTVVLTVTDVNNNVSTCESTVTVIDTVRPVAECKDITVYLDETGNISIAEDSINNGSLDACGGLTFDTDVTAFGCSDVGDNTVVLTITDVNNNVSTCESSVTVIDTVRPVAECKDITVYLDETGNISIAEDSINNGSLDACGGLTFDTDVTAFGCSDVGDNTVVLTITDVNNNVSTCESSVTVIDTVRPVAECKDITVYLDETGNISIAEDSINNGSLDACGGLTFDTDVTAFGCADVGDNTVVLTVTDVSGNVSTCESTVTVIDTVRPVAECKDITVYLDETGNISIAEDSINNGSSDACGGLTFDTDMTAFGCADVGGDNTVILTVTDVNGNVSTCESIVTVIDTVRPVAECKDISVYLDETGNISIAEDSINNGSSDTCGGLTFDTDVTAFGCSDVGDNTVVLTVTDVNNNVSTCESTVSVIDTVRPVAECKDITVYLDETGNISIAEDSINNGSSDACGGLTFDTDVTAFGCSDVGDNTVVLTVTDVNNNVSTCESTVTVIDTVRPVAECKDITVYLDETGNISIAEDSINNGSLDACGGLTFDTDVTAFGCADVGDNTVVLTVTDVSGNVSTCESTVTVIDTVRPVAECKDITVYLDETGNISIAEDSINNGSSDACGGLIFDTDVTAFGCSDVGDNIVVLTVTDVNNNVSTCESTVTVIDTVRPVAECKDITVYLDETGNISIAEDSINNGSSDACGGLTFDTDMTAFGCADVGGDNTVILTVTDVNGNVSTCESIVTVIDTVRPVAECKDISVYLDETGNISIAEDSINNGSSDTCGGLTFDTDVTAFGCSDVGDNTVVLTVTDVNNNVSTCESTVSVIDTVRPVAECKDITVYLDETGNISIAEDSINNGSSDACGGLTFDTDVTAFGCSDVGDNTVVLTVTDVNNNVSTCESTVTVIDTVRPVAECKDITVYLDETGNISIAEDSINNGSLDACGGLTFDTDVTAFGCADVGDNTVVLTVTDVSGNVSTCESTVTVIDTVRPVAECKDITVYLDETGNISIAEDSINNGSSDACGGLIFDTDVTAFGCSDVGDNIVVLTVTDVNNNVSTCESTVTVIDTVRPVAECKDITVYLDETGNISIAEDSINNGSSDACGGLTFDTDVTAFGCSDVGDNTVVLTVADESGNISTCESTVIVIDTIPPVTRCKDVLVYLDASGAVSIPEDLVNDNSSGACGGLTFDTNVTAFGCSDVGDNTVILTVIDINGNVSTCESTVTVIDTVRPVAECKDITVYLDNTGNISIAEDSINNVSSDGCGGLTFDTNITDFSCTDVGDNTVVLTVTDVNENISTCESVIMVVDTVLPELEVQNITVGLDETGNAFITVADLVTFANDNCTLSDTLISQLSFDCSNVGENNVDVTLRDLSGNEVVQTATVTVEDNLGPVFDGNDIDVYLDSSGFYVFNDEDIVELFGAITDNCSNRNEITLVGANTNSFDCTALGENEVQLLARDIYGNESVSVVSVFVRDSLSPKIDTVPDVEVEIAWGAIGASIDYPEIEVNDNCEAELSLLEGLGDDGMFPVGTTTEKWMATDNSGNTDTISFNVIVTEAEPITAFKILAKVNNEIISPDSIEYSFFTVSEDDEFVYVENDYIVSGDTVVYDVEPGNWIIRGAPVADTSSSFLSTYTGDVLRWEDASMTMISEGEELLIVLSCVEAPVLDGPYKISGYVYTGVDNSLLKSSIKKTAINDERARFNSALIKLSSGDEDKLLKTIETDEFGFYEFTRLPEGEYFVDVDIPGLTQIERYKISVNESNPGGSISFVAQYGTNIILDSEIQEQNSHVLVYPNPTDGLVIVDIDLGIHEIALWVIDIKGNVVLKKEYFANEKVVFDMSGKVPGIYFVKMDIDGERIVKTIVVKGK